MAVLWLTLYNSQSSSIRSNNGNPTVFTQTWTVNIPTHNVQPKDNDVNTWNDTIPQSEYYKNPKIDLTTGSLSKWINTWDDLLIQYIKTWDKNLCDKITDPYLTMICKNMDRKKYTLKDSSAVYSVLAFETKNSSLCQKIKDEKLKGVCIWSVENNYKLNNVLNKARELNDPKLCEKLEDENSRKECSDKYNYFIKFDKLLQTAISKNDKTICNSATDEQMKKECISIVSTNPEYNKYLEEAIKNKDLSSCYKISLPGRVEDCKREYNNRVR